MNNTELLITESALRSEAASVRAELKLDELLNQFGDIYVVGSTALSVMVAKDIDMTVAVEKLDVSTKKAVVSLAGILANNKSVRETTVRDDTGAWNTDPAYPDGLYLKLLCTDGWKFDIWFVDQPERQPDIAQLESLKPLMTDKYRATILHLKTNYPEFPSFEVYNAVILHGAETFEDVRAYIASQQQNHTG